MKEDAEEGHEASQERNKPQENSLSKILGSKISIVCYNDKIIDISFHLVLTENFEEINVILEILFNIIELSWSKVKGFKVQNRSSFIIFSKIFENVEFTVFLKILPSIFVSDISFPLQIMFK